VRACRLDLPPSLRIKVASANYRDMIDRCSFVGRHFAGCKPRFFNALMIILKPIHIIPGDTIVFKEEVPRELYFVYQGALQVVSPATHFLFEAPLFYSLFFPTLFLGKWLTRDPSFSS
jgi:hypothetical protein